MAKSPKSPRRIAIVGAGLAGLCAANAARDVGANVVVFERGKKPGGTTILSNGWVWRYRDKKLLRWGAPHGDKKVQDVLWEDLPQSLTWAEGKGIRFAARSTANPLTDGVRIDPQQAIDVLDRRLPQDAIKCDSAVYDIAQRESGELRISVMRNSTYDDGRWLRSGEVPDSLSVRTVDVDAVIFAGGGYAADVERLERENGTPPAAADTWSERNSGLSNGSSMDCAVALGAHLVPVSGEFYARAMPYGVVAGSRDWTNLAQLYAEHAVAIVDANGTLIERQQNDWSDTQTIWRIGRTTGKGWYLLDHASLAQSTPYGPVSRLVGAALDSGGTVIEAPNGNLADLLAASGAVELSLHARERVKDCVCAVAVRPGITHTMGGLRIDARARVVTDARTQNQLFAAGIDVGGVSNGGYASGLAQALALGRIAGVNAAMTNLR